jgi:hypothetical protein
MPFEHAAIAIARGMHPVSTCWAWLMAQPCNWNNFLLGGLYILYWGPWAVGRVGFRKNLFREGAVVWLLVPAVCVLRAAHCTLLLHAHTPYPY